MSKVTTLIKQMMLTYPLLYPTRNRAMIDIFLTTNYYWNQKGEIVPAYPFEEDFEGPIDISDLAKSDAEWKDHFDEFSQCILVRNELERRTRLFRAEHIDQYAKYGEADRYSYSDLDDWYLENDRSVLFSAPFGKIDPEWAQAMEAFIADMQVAYNQVFMLHYDKEEQRQRPEPSMFSQMPEKFQRRYNRLMDVADKLEAQTGAKAKEQKFWADHSAKLMAEIADG